MKKVKSSVLVKWLISKQRRQKMSQIRVHKPTRKGNQRKRANLAIRIFRAIIMRVIVQIRFMARSIIINSQKRIKNRRSIRSQEKYAMTNHQKGIFNSVIRMVIIALEITIIIIIMSGAIQKMTTGVIITTTTMIGALLQSIQGVIIIIKLHLNQDRITGLQTIIIVLNLVIMINIGKNEIRKSTIKITVDLLKSAVATTISREATIMDTTRNQDTEQIQCMLINVQVKAQA